MFLKGFDEIPFGGFFRTPQQFRQYHGGVSNPPGDGCDPFPVPAGPQMVDKDRCVEQEDPIPHGLRTGASPRALTSTS